MSDKNFYVIKPTKVNKQPVELGETLSLTESQARPLINGGFLTRDKGAATLIEKLSKQIEKLTEENKGEK